MRFTLIRRAPSTSDYAPSPRQDMPPAGGYPQFNWKRTYPRTGTWMRARYMFPAAALAIVYGFAQEKQNHKHKITEKFEDIDLLAAMEPFLKAERDRAWLKILLKNRQMEEEVMKDVPGWVVGTWYGEPVYFTMSDGWYDPSEMEVYAHSTKRWTTRGQHFHMHDEYCLPKWYDKYLPEWILKRIW